MTYLWEFEHVFVMTGLPTGQCLINVKFDILEKSTEKTVKTEIYNVYVRSHRSNELLKKKGFQDS